MNTSGKSAGDDRLPMEKINRSKVEGFTKYFSYRTGHFYDIFGVPFSVEAAKREFKKVEELFWFEESV